jgi:hypothetical protein
MSLVDARSIWLSTVTRVQIDEQIDRRIQNKQKISNDAISSQVLVSHGNERRRNDTNPSRIFLVVRSRMRKLAGAWTNT